ncbi:signal transduction histidine kinase [Nonlabens dokdonensis]|jgi:signal transduction histidine kinase|uniref:histidine kinase n=2 Tax=Nonlabens dokdonensis TaxID=328515 RepID=L7WFJ6_NONDD|nr:response regulator [Nonlabens dokdonensis]AGC77678.1 sensor protein [Nonlabens dokdonensis DSW-6]PZX39782.1 signal transduction histidine kinase [Nonlabens dokdonensis]
MSKKHTVFYCLFLFILFTGFAQQDVEVYHKENLNYDEKQLDSVSYVLMEYYNKGTFEKILEQSPALIQNAIKIDAYQLELRFRNILGSTFIKLDDIENANIFFNHALQTAKKKKDSIGVMMMYISLGNTHFKDDKEKALAYFNKGLDFGYNGDRSEDGKFIIHHNLAELYIKKKNLAKAKYHLSKIVDKIDQQEPAVRRKGYAGTTNFIKASIHLMENQPALAIEDALLALKTKDDYDETYLLETYMVLMESYEKLEDFKNVVFYNKLYDSLRAVQYEKDKIEQQQIAKVDLHFDNIEKELRASELENDLINQKATESNLYLIFSIVVGLLLFLILMLLLKEKTKRDKLLKILTQKNAEYLKAKEKSEELARSNTKFLSTISHELRTPLYGIIGLSSLFLKEPKLRPFENDFKSLKFSADYLLALVNDVLHINKFNSKKGQELQEVHFNLSTLLFNIKSSFDFLNEKHNNDVELIIDPKIPEILYGDQTKISQVLMNLMSNASKFTEDGSVKLEVIFNEKKDDHYHLLFRIQDTGRGIQLDQQKAIFEEFTQVKDVNDLEHHGTGLGIPIVNKILFILGSTLELDSTYKVGSTFSFQLSLKEGEAENITQEVASKNIKSLAGKRVLTVDDNKINQLVTQKVLDQIGMLHSTASDGLEAIKMAKSSDFDFILMDINMPVMNGIIATQEIRKFNQNTPIIALTATIFNNPEEEIYCYGFNSIIVKPYRTAHLVEAFLKEL